MFATSLEHETRVLCFRYASEHYKTSFVRSLHRIGLEWPLSRLVTTVNSLADDGKAGTYNGSYAGFTSYCINQCERVKSLRGLTAEEETDFSAFLGDYGVKCQRAPTGFKKFDRHVYLDDRKDTDGYFNKDKLDASGEVKYELFFHQLT